MFQRNENNGPTPGEFFSLEKDIPRRYCQEAKRSTAGSVDDSGWRVHSVKNKYFLSLGGSNMYPILISSGITLQFYFHILFGQLLLDSVGVYCRCSAHISN